ncbi:MAG: alpha/beta hydrolase [Alphaproteobacteria bacterium]|nr:MAG: alpha/beta hydrolase [Alphaproteobacteria bacterium]
MLVAIALASPTTAQTASAAADPFAEARTIIADVQKLVSPESVDETHIVTLNGARQVINVRGSNRANPILVYIHGGPGSVEMPMAWTFQRPWEDYFTVVQWDQRGAGRSWPLNDPAVIEPTLRLETYRDDAIALIEWLNARYHQRKVILLGHSFGSAVGLTVAQARPDLLHAYVGMGQLIDFRENERVGMRNAINSARENGDERGAATIESLAPYPDSGPFTIQQADAWRAVANKYGSLVGERPDAHFYFNSTKLSPLYSPCDLQAWGEGSSFTVTALWPRLADVSFSEVRMVETPVVLFLGRHDNTTPSSIAARWLSGLEAPVAEAVWFEHSGHLPMVEEPGRVLAALLTKVLPLVRETSAESSAFSPLDKSHQ